MAEDGASQMNFPAEEVATLKYWAEIDAFKTSLKLSEGKPEYTFYDGPPFATGLPHYGHILAGTIKDTVTRYAHQTGHHVSRRFGWDCHGLPVEFEIDKMLGISARDDVLKMGIDKYNEKCRSIVQRYTAEWETVVTRLGRWIDFKNDYRTMDTNFMESVWWVFKTMFDKGLVYRGHKVMPYSTACSTPLSNFEAGLNYKDVVDPAVVVAFALVDEPATSLVAWTTTPWTLPSNLALCVNEGLVYVKVRAKDSGRVFILAEARLVQLFPVLGSKKFKAGTEATVYEVLEKLTGKDLVGVKYEPLFTCFDGPTRRKTCWRVVADAYVTSDAGTGVVHQAPAFGDDDYRVCSANGIFDPRDETGLPCPVDANGRFSAEIGAVLPDIVGLHVKAADPLICTRLKEAGRLVSKDQFTHSYPFCWRSDTPLIYKAVPSWFINVEAIKDKLLKNNEATYWVPAAVKENRFRNWLADAKDWAVSRNRFWGTPIPLWVSDDGEEVVAVGSIEELKRLTGLAPDATVDDIHRHHVDQLEIPSQKRPGTVLRRVDEVFDCWFESGSMPYAQLHYPFECTDEAFAKKFPADFIAEGLDQTRGWFYTLMVISTALFDKPAFQNLIVNGLVLAADGKKMSKRLKNYPDPTLVIDAYGSDALRLYLINSPVVKGETLKFTEPGVRGVLRDVIFPWFNAYRFFAQQVERWEATGDEAMTLMRDEARAAASTNTMDRWIRASMESLVDFVHAEMQAYRLYTVVPRLVGFLQDLTNLYVRLNRSRLKGVEGDEAARTSLAVLFEVLLKMATMMAPFTPFFAEFLYQRLRPRLAEFAAKATAPKDALGAADSIHYCALPTADLALVDGAVVTGMRLLKQVLEIGRAVREAAKISMKTPVKRVVVVSSDVAALAALKSALEPYILDELNTWETELTSDLDAWCSLSALPCLPVLARKLGKRMRAATEAIKSLGSPALRSYLATGKITVTLDDGTTLDLVADELIVKTTFKGDAAYAAESTFDGSITVAIDIRQDDALRMQGIARAVCTRVNKLRKKAKLAMADAVDVYFHDDEPGPLSTADALKANRPMLEKAKIFPIPLAGSAAAAACARPEIASDVAPTTGGSPKLRVAICAPRPALHPKVLAAFKGNAEALTTVVTALAPLSLQRFGSTVQGSLDGEPFEFTVGKDIFPDGTAAYLAALA